MDAIGFYTHRPWIRQAAALMVVIGIVPSTQRNTDVEAAVAACRRTLEQLTRERQPLEWAEAQNCLGTALIKLGDWMSGTARLEEAVSAYREALTAVTRERGWALRTGGQAVTLMRLAERTQNGAMARAAAAQIGSVLDTIRSGGRSAFAEYYEARLEEARTLVQQISGQ